MQDTNFDEKLQQFAELVERQQAEKLRRDNMGEINVRCHRTRVVPGRKYAKVDIGSPESTWSGRYMVENDTGRIYGVKAYGVIHRGYYFGTLDTIDEYEWGGYWAGKRTQPPTIGPADEVTKAFATCDECGRRFEGEDASEASDLLSAHTMIAHKPEPQETPGGAELARQWIEEDRAARVIQFAPRAERRLYVPRMPETEPRAIEPSETRP